MKCLQTISLLACVVAASALAADRDPAPTGNLLSLGRMGAGIPAGWKVGGNNFTWEAEAGGEQQAHGPRPFVTCGAARIRFGDGGRLTLESPARFLQPGAHHVAFLWLRSAPAGARVQLCVRDNDSDAALLEGSAEATEAWQPVLLQGVLPEAIRGHCYLSLVATGDGCVLGMDGLWLGQTQNPVEEDWRPPIPEAGVVLEPDTPWGVVTGDAPMRVRVRVAGVTRAGCRLALRAVHTCGMTAELPAVPLDSSGFWQETIEVSSDIARPFGMLRVEATVVDEGGAPLSPMGETLLARAPAPAPGPCPESPFGVHVSLREPDVEAVAKLGYKWCRIHDASAVTKWGYVEPEPGQWTWYDEDIALARRHGLCVLGLLDGSPPWESGTTQEGYFRIYGAPRNMDNWRAYVRNTVGHYAGKIDDWEVWNEPWDMQRFFHGGTPQLYVALLAAAYEEAKAANPDCTVVGIDTYPPLWEKVVLAMGAYPHYDVLSWHRYDPCLHGRPNDAIARVAERLRAEQATYGNPKPLMCSEGGPDVARFHGSFFSFAEPAIVGKWSRGADQYPRMFLSSIASGNQRFIAYSVHNEPRHGQPTHMMVEPGYLLRPMHLTLAALAHFIEGADFAGRISPALDITALVFRQSKPRPYNPAPSTVVVLFANGEEPETLPAAIPPEVRCYDRWGNPAPTPRQATRSPVYLVATGEAAQALLEAMKTPPISPDAASAGDIHALLDATLTAFSAGDPPLHTLLSAQGSVVVLGTPEGYHVANRQDLRANADCAADFRLPGPVTIVQETLKPAGQFTLGCLHLAGGSPETAAQAWVLTFAAVRDGPAQGWRYTTLAVVLPEETGVSAGLTEPLDIIRRWEAALAQGNTRSLYGQFYDGPCCAAASTLNGEYFVFSEPEYLISMLNTVVLWGPAKLSKLSFSEIAGDGGVATVFGKWNLVHPVFGSAPYAITGTLVHTDTGWRTVSLCASAG